MHVDCYRNFNLESTSVRLDCVSIDPAIILIILRLISVDLAVRFDGPSNFNVESTFDRLDYAAVLIKKVGIYILSRTEKLNKTRSYLICPMYAIV